MHKKLVFLVLFTTFFTFPPFLYAQNAESVRIIDVLSEDGSLNETINIVLAGNEQTEIELNFPADSKGIWSDSFNVSGNSTSFTLPLDCEICNLTFSYYIDGVVKDDEGPGHVAFSRTLSLPVTPKKMRYEVVLPPGYAVEPHNDSDPSIVPKESEILTDGKSIIIIWEEDEPKLPQRYFIRYKKSVFEKSFLSLEESWQKAQAFLTLAAVFLTGTGFGFFLNRFLKKALRKKRPHHPPVPASLLSLDEKKILGVLEQNGRKMSQKDVGKKLEWSKSKVSAIMTNLEYKKIVKREKIGRNYKVEVIKEITEAS